MKIHPQEFLRIAQAYVREVQVRPARPEARAAGADQVEVSGGARAVLALSERVRAARPQEMSPEVARIVEQVQEGTYTVDPATVAARMLSRILADRIR